MEPSILQDLLVQEQYQLTAEEWLIVKLIFFGLDDDTQRGLIPRLYASGGLTTRTLRANLLSLQEKGIFTKEYKVPSCLELFDPEAVVFNKNFLKNHLRYSLEMGEELYNAYPDKINGYDMRNCTRIFRDAGQDGLFREYGKKISWNPETHKHILDILKRSLDRNLISYGICEFVLSRKWRDLEQQLENGDRGKLDITNFIDEFDY